MGLLLLLKSKFCIEYETNKSSGFWQVFGNGVQFD